MTEGLGALQGLESSPSPFCLFDALLFDFEIHPCSKLNSYTPISDIIFQLFPPSGTDKQLGYPAG